MVIGLNRIINLSLVGIFSIFFLHLLFSLNDFNFFVNFNLFQFTEGLRIIYILGFDLISVIFIFLSGFLLLICILFSWFISYKGSWFMSLLCISFFILINVFGVTDLILFFFFFELLIVPMYLIIGIWGGRSRKIYAAYLFLLYTLLGSVLLLFAFVFIVMLTGSSNFEYLIGVLFCNLNQTVIFLFIFFGLSVKIPIVPFHLWLPEAHVEAPTAGSIILAGIVLKLGFYAFIRILFFCVNGWLISFVFVIFLIGFYFPSFSAISQVDIKKIIAYSSVSHMNFGMFGLFSKQLVGFVGSFFLMLGHAIVASALFLTIGTLYERYKTRIIFYYSGLFFLMPLWSVSFFIFILGNFGLPGTVNFVGELLILFSIFNFKVFLLFLMFIGLILTLGYSLFLYVRMVNGILIDKFIRYYCDLTRREFILFVILIVGSLLYGILPQLWLDILFYPVYLIWFII